MQAELLGAKFRLRVDLDRSCPSSLVSRFAKPITSFEFLTPNPAVRIFRRLCRCDAATPTPTPQLVLAQ